MKTYYINIDDLNDGMTTISLVNQPAIEVDFLKFENQLMTFANDDKHTIYGPAILADIPIYRRSPRLGEYQIVFSKEVIEKIVLKYSQQGLWNVVNLQHNADNYIDNIVMTSVFIKNVERGLDPVDFKDVPEGSLFVEFKVTDDELWNELKNSDKINGFSIEILAELTDEKFEITNTEDSLDQFVNNLLN